MDDRLFKLLTRPQPNKNRSFNAYDYAFYSTNEVKKNDSRLSVSNRVFVIAPQQIENCGLWVHEFSELTIIGLIEAEGKDWHVIINWKKYGFKNTIISHIMTPFGLDNKRCLVPQPSKKYPKW